MIIVDFMNKNPNKDWSDMPILFTDKIDCYDGFLQRNSSVMCHYIKFVP